MANIKAILQAAINLYTQQNDNLHTPEDGSIVYIFKALWTNISPRPM